LFSVMSKPRRMSQTVGTVEWLCSSPHVLSLSIIPVKIQEAWNPS